MITTPAIRRLPAWWRGISDLITDLRPLWHPVNLQPRNRFATAGGAA